MGELLDELGWNVDFHRLSLADDFMFGEVMRRPEICRMFLESLLHTEIGRVEYINKQQDMSDSMVGHGIRIDVYLKDGKNTVYSVEMQRRGKSGIFKRIRYYQGTIDRNNLGKSGRYADVPDSFIIMICTFDPFRYGLAVYERRFAIRDCPDALYDDGSHVFLLNSAYATGNAEKPVLEFLDCIRSNNIDAQSYTTPLMKEICPAIKEVRNDSSKEAIYMTMQLKMQELRWEAEDQGRAKGRAEGREAAYDALIAAMAKKGMPVSLIAELTGRTEEQVSQYLAALSSEQKSAMPPPV